MYLSEKYDYVGRLLKPGEEPSEYTDEEDTKDHNKQDWTLNNQSQGPSELQFLLPFTECLKCLGLVHLLQNTFNRLCTKLNESHYEDLNTRHSLCCQTHLLQLFVMSGGASSSWKKGDRDFFFKSKKVTRLLFPFFYFSLNQRQPDTYLLLECTNLRNSKGFLLHVLCFRFSTEGRRRPGQEKWGCTSIWVV